jgi:hypothetical protein
VAERESAAIGQAQFGGFSIDLKGQGGENLKAVALALQSSVGGAKAKGVEFETQSVVETLRAKDNDATAVLNRRKDEARAAVKKVFGEAAEIKISGDDIVVIPKGRAEPAKLFRELAQTMKGGYRATFVESAPQAASKMDHLATWAEGQEKVLRNNLEGVVSHEKLTTLNFSSTVRDGSRLEFNCHYGPLDCDQFLTGEEWRRVQSAMSELQKRPPPPPEP